MKYLNKSFSVFANYEKIPRCDKCGAKETIFWSTINGKLCKECYGKAKEKKSKD